MKQSFDLVGKEIKMSIYYEEMSKDFKEAVEVIKRYCQFEDCDISECKDCPHPLRTIRCGDDMDGALHE